MFVPPLAFDSQFRRNPLWGFFQFDRLNKSELFHKEKIRRALGRPTAAKDERDPYTRLFGQGQPSDLPGTTEYWKKQQKELYALSDETENGLFQFMTTITHTDSCPEMLAAIRRGPGARPTEAEMVEYLMGRKPRDQHGPFVF